MDKVLKLYKLVGEEERPFPSSNEQIITSDFVYNAKRMGAAPTMTCTVRHPQSLNTEWGENVFVNFNGSKFYLRKTPSSTYDNTDVRYKYELEFISEHVLLDNVYFFDVSPDSAYRGVSNTTTCTFSGNIQMFVKKLNASLQYSKLQIVNTDGTIEGYQVFLPSDIDSEYKHLSFTDQFFSSALQEIYNTFELPYYFKGKEIYVGHADTDTSLDVTLRYGQDEGLLSITKQNANHKLINRITGVGSTDNIPYYYPNETPLGSIAIETLPTNTYFEARDLVIADTELLAQRIELNNPVKYFKYEVNKFDSILMRSIWETGDLHPASLGVYTGWESLLPKTEEVTADGAKHTYNYQLSFIGETTYAGGGLFRLAWQPPSHLDINDFIRLHGDIEYGVFENLRCYEFRDDKRVELEIKQVGQYPNIILEVYFQGYEGTISTFEGHVFDIYIEFTHWTHNVGSDAVYYGFSTTGFSSLSLNPGMDTTYTWKSSKFASPNLSDFGIIATRYPVNTDTIVGEGFTIQQTSYVIPQPNLMPAIYRDTAFVERFYNATNNTYTDTSGDYYQFEHPYIEGQPKEHIQNFEEIKPTIVGMVNAEGQPYNQFLEIAYDEGDNDEIDEKTETLLHPYFYVKLPKYNGTGAFNLFDHASESGAMQISMTSGSLSACTFDIAVSDTTQKNTVQIDSNGNLKRDEWGNVVRGTAQPEQNDTINNEVWIALHKDVTTFSSPVPNTGVINQPAVGDTFVILNIALPQGYIEAAEKRLEQELIRYMSENNSEKFNFSIKFSRIYLEEHPDVQAKLTENSSIIIEYQGKEYPLYVSSYTYKMTSNALLPEISVELADTLTIQKNAVEHMVGQAKTDILNTIASTNFVRQGVPYFLRKDVDDSAQGRLRFLNGFDSLSDAKFGNFRENTSGASVYQDESGNWHIETDFVRVRKKLSVKSIEIEEAHHIGGQQLLTAASAYIAFVVDKGSYFRCFFLKEDSSGRHTYNQWKVGDQAYCRCFNLISQTEAGEQQVGDKYYWRKVVATSLTTTEEAISFTINGETLLTANYHFIDLSDRGGEYDTLSDIPAADDCVVQLGYQGEEEENKSRQNAIILAGSGEGSPYIQQFVGINTFSLTNCLETQIKPNDNILTGKVVVQKGSSGLDNLEEWAGKQAQIDAATELAEHLEATTAHLDQYITDVKTGLSESIGAINRRLDGVVINHFYPYNPDSNSAPTNAWTTDAVREEHLGDTFTNTLPYQNADGTVNEGAGQSWRWVGANDEVDDYHWELIAENDAIEALKKASEAYDVADSKRRVFVNPPNNPPNPPYEIGDLWAGGANTQLQRCIKTRLSGTFDASEWADADDSHTYANTIRQDIENKINITQQTLDAKIESAQDAIEAAQGDTTELSMALDALKDSQLTLEDVFTKAEVDGKITDAEANAIADAQKYADDAIAYYDLLVKAMADGVIDEKEKEKIQGALAALLEAKAHADKAAEQAKQDAINNTTEALNKLRSTNGNLLRNSGFTGDFDTANLKDDVPLSSALEMFSPSLEHWTAENAEAYSSSYSQSGKCVYFTTQGSISQVLLHKVRVGEDYVFSFTGRGGTVTLEFGGISRVIDLYSYYERHVVRLQPTSDTQIVTIRATANSYLYDLMLEYGNIVSDWTPSIFDNQSTMAKYESLSYLQNLLKVETIVSADGVQSGIVNTGLVNMGHYDENGNISRVTAGLSGTCNSDNSVAFFAGGDLQQALVTVSKFDDNPAYVPTNAELANMAKAVITHGGRAILQDIILRGHVYADSGYFRGTVYATDGEFHGLLTGTSAKGEVQVGIPKDSPSSILRVTSANNINNIEAGFYPSLEIAQAAYGTEGMVTLTIGRASGGTTLLNGQLVQLTQTYITNDQEETYSARIANAFIEITKSQPNYGRVLIQPTKTIFGGHEVHFDTKVFLDTSTLPTDSSNCESGQLYRDGDTLKIKV